MSDEAPTGVRLGDWYAFCDVCGRRFFGSTLLVRWDNVIVCSDDFEDRHPQDFVKSYKDTRTPPLIRPDQTKGEPAAFDPEEPTTGDPGWYDVS